VEVLNTWMPIIPPEISNRPRPAKRISSTRPEHWNDKFLFRTNWDAKNFRLMEAPVSSDPRRENWKDVLPHRDDVLLDGFTVFKDHLVTAEHKGGLSQVHIIRWADKADHYIEVGEPTYACFVDNNPEFDTKTLALRLFFHENALPPSWITTWTRRPRKSKK
jgi:oligopeptidase B